MSRLSKYEQGLNPAQLEAVRHIDGPMLVLAGAGSGKTRVVTRRMAYIIARKKALPSEILAVTFTNKAAAEMRDRVAHLTGKKQAAEITISTFHSYCLKVLREHIELLGFRKNFTVSGEGDVRTLIRRVIEDLDGSQEEFSPGILREHISLMKGKSGDDAYTLPRPTEESDDELATREKYETWLPEIHERYQSALRAANTLDFDDLLQFVLRLWQEHPKVRGHFQRRYKYIMVDEYQDTNDVQYNLIQTLVGKHKNLCVVGDDDQSIYGWRGADVKNILQFEKDFPKAKIVTLNQNYRSVEPIVKAANALIAHNSKRRDKAMVSACGEGPPIDHVLTGDEEHEAKLLVEWLQNFKLTEGADNHDFAVLYRSNNQSRAIEIVLRGAQIPYAVYGGQDFFERSEVKDVIAYFKVLANPRDEPSFLRIVNMPRRGIGDKTLHAVHDLCREKKLSLGKGMAVALKSGVITGRAEQGIRQFLGIVGEYRARFRERNQPMADIAREMVQRIGYKAEMERTSKTPEHAGFRWDNVEAVLDALEEYEKNAQQPSLMDFLDRSSLNSDADRSAQDDRKKNGITLMTMHGAKGLEFPYVFIVGAEEGLLPHARSLRDGTVEEERRLFYVALTRAQKRLIITETCTRTQHGRQRISTPSRFLKELPQELLKHHTFAARDMVTARIDTPKPKGKGKRKSKPKVKPALPKKPAAKQPKPANPHTS